MLKKDRPLAKANPNSTIQTQRTSILKYILYFHAFADSSSRDMSGAPLHNLLFCKSLCMVVEKVCSQPFLFPDRK